MSGLGKVLIVAGLALAALGGLFVLYGKVPLLGKLPGDFLIERPGFTIYLPLGTCLVLSVVLSVVLWFLNR